MRLFITLALVMLPMTAAQLYSTDSFAIANKTIQQENLSDKTIFSMKHDTKIETSADNIFSKKRSTTEAKSKQLRTKDDPSLKTRKAKLMRSKNSSQGMQLLSMLLLIKDKSR